MTLREIIDTDYLGLDLDVPHRAWRTAGLPRRDVTTVGDLTLDEAEVMVGMNVSTTDGERFQANLLGTLLAAYDAAGRAGQAHFERRWQLFLKNSQPLATAVPDGYTGFVGTRNAKEAKPSRFKLTMGGSKIQ